MEELELLPLGLGLEQGSYPSPDLCAGIALTPASCEFLHVTLVRISSTLKICCQSLPPAPQTLCPLPQLIDQRLNQLDQSLQSLNFSCPKPCGQVILTSKHVCEIYREVQDV